MSGKHTPGPWRAVRNSAYWEVEPQNRRAEDPYSVADCCCSDPGHPDAGLQEANARLIAAAPELLELVKMVHGSFGGGLVVTFSEQDVEAFAAAIAKAEGQS